MFAVFGRMECWLRFELPLGALSPLPVAVGSFDCDDVQAAGFLPRASSDRPINKLQIGTIPRAHGDRKRGRRIERFPETFQERLHKLMDFAVRTCVLLLAFAGFMRIQVNQPNAVARQHHNRTGKPEPVAKMPIRDRPVTSRFVDNDLGE